MEAKASLRKDDVIGWKTLNRWTCGELDPNARACKARPRPVGQALARRLSSPLKLQFIRRITHLLVRSRLSRWD